MDTSLLVGQHRTAPKPGRDYQPQSVANRQSTKYTLDIFHFTFRCDTVLLKLMYSCDWPKADAIAELSKVCAY